MTAQTLHGCHIFQPEQRPQDCYDWITREQITRIAATAYEVAKRDCHPQQGEPFISPNGWPESDRVTFALKVGAVFAFGIHAEAYNLGLADHLRADAQIYLDYLRPDRAARPS